jgi:hypothetical protein
MSVVRFVVSHPPYRATELASFTPVEALRLVEVLKVAEPIELVKLKKASGDFEAGQVISVTPEEAAELVRTKVGSYAEGKADWPAPAPPAEPSSPPSGTTTPDGAKDIPK